jgi:micrococcal nuclease
MLLKLLKKRFNKQLQESSLENTNKYSLEGKKKHCKVVKVYDGDTITINMRVHNKIYQYNIRLLGYDTPEIRTKDLDEKKAGYVARDFLSNLLMEKIVIIKCGGFDKYGRLLGEIYLSKKDYKLNNSINLLMVERGFGTPYYI